MWIQWSSVVGLWLVVDLQCTAVRLDCDMEDGQQARLKAEESVLSRKLQKCVSFKQINHSTKLQSVTLQNYKDCAYYLLYGYRVVKFWYCLDVSFSHSTISLYESLDFNEDLLLAERCVRTRAHFHCLASAMAANAKGSIVLFHKCRSWFHVWLMKRYTVHFQFLPKIIIKLSFAPV